MTDINSVLSDIIKMVKTTNMSDTELVGFGAFLFGVAGEIALSESQNSSQVKQTITSVLQQKLNFTEGQATQLFIDYVRSSKPGYNQALFGIIDDGQKAFRQYKARDMEGVMTNLLSKMMFAKMFAQLIPVPKKEAPAFTFDIILKKYPLEDESINHFYKIFGIISSDVRSMSSNIGGIKLPEKSVADFCQLLFYKTIGIEHTINKRPTYKISAPFIDKYFGEQISKLRHHLEVFSKYSMTRGVPKNEMAFYLIHLYHEAVHNKYFKEQVFEMYDE